MSAATGAGEDRVYGRFGRLGAAYDAARREFPRQTIACALRNLPGQDPFVLDLACGTGISTRQLAAGGIKVAGCDIDPLMLSYVTERGGAHIRYAIGRAEAIPFKDAGFDAVTSFYGYHWFDPPAPCPRSCACCGPRGASLSRT
jgi:ubiquinone/menaquinone biosynthesis C-methylase UbiE